MKINFFKVILNKRFPLEISRGVRSNSENLFVIMWDPYVDEGEKDFRKKYKLNKTAAIFFIGTKHKYFKNFKFYKGSKVIDPFRYLNKQKNVNYMKRL